MCKEFKCHVDETSGKTISCKSLSNVRKCTGSHDDCGRSIGNQTSPVKSPQDSVINTSHVFGATQFTSVLSVSSASTCSCSCSPSDVSFYFWAAQLKAEPEQAEGGIMPRSLSKRVAVIVILDEISQFPIASALPFFSLPSPPSKLKHCFAASTLIRALVGTSTTLSVLQV